MWELVTQQLSKDKERELWQELEANPDLMDDYRKLKQSWSLSAAEQHFTEQQISNKYQQFKKQYQHQPIVLQWLKQSIRYAAAIAITLLISYSYLHINNSETLFINPISHIEAGTGAVNNIVLADGSKIWLNSNSTIDIISAEDNKVCLELKGEALFDIIHDENRQFIVNVKNLTIEDLGTRFTVRNYPNDKEISATLLDGEIAIKDTLMLLSETLEPGQQLRYSLIDGSYSLDQVDTTYVGKWTEEKFEFVNKTLEDIAKDIENWYGVTVLFKEDKLKYERFTGVIQKSTSVEKVLDIIAYSAGIKYSINPLKDKIEIMIH